MSCGRILKVEDCNYDRAGVQRQPVRPCGEREALCRLRTGQIQLAKIHPQELRLLHLVRHRQRDFRSVGTLGG